MIEKYRAENRYRYCSVDRGLRRGSKCRANADSRLTLLYTIRLRVRCADFERLSIPIAGPFRPQ